MLLGATIFTDQVNIGLLHLLDDVTAYDSGRYRNDGITEDHDEGCKYLAYRSDWSDITVTYSRQRDDGPINALWYGMKVRIMLVLCEVH